MTATIRSRTLRTWGLAESTLAELLAGRMAALDAAGERGADHRLPGQRDRGHQGPHHGQGGHPRPSGRACSTTEERPSGTCSARRCSASTTRAWKAAVGKLLVAAGLTLGLAESLTGGLVGSRISAVPGASDWFRGSIVAYASDVKRKLLGVGDGPVVSEAAAEEMATGRGRALGADVGLALTGVAGPTEQDGQPVGTVWVGLAIDGELARPTASLSAGRPAADPPDGHHLGPGSPAADADRRTRLPLSRSGLTTLMTSLLNNPERRTGGGACRRI